jgi:hypothetical protein
MVAIPLPVLASNISCQQQPPHQGFQTAEDGADKCVTFKSCRDAATTMAYSVTLCWVDAVFTAGQLGYKHV